MIVNIGHTNAHFGEKAVELDSSRHTLITGKSGVGKSTLLINLAISHIRNGDGILFMDPHGDAADKILRFIPKRRIKDVVLFDPLAKRVPGLNIFDYAKEEDVERAVQSFLTMVSSLAGPSGWGAESERVLNAAADAILKALAKPTVIEVYLFLMRPKFRAELYRKTKDPLLRDFIQQYDEELRPGERMNKFSPPINKTDKFLRPFIRTMVGQETSFDFKAAMDTKKIIIAKLPKGQLGSVTASLIGSIIVSQMSIAAMQRSTRTPCVWLIDEIQNFSHGVDLGTVVAELRKYGIALISAFQNLAQMPHLQSLFGNCSNLLSYRMGGADAALLAAELGNDDYGPAIVSLPDRAFYASLLRDGSPLVELVDALPPLDRRGDEAYWKDVIKVSRQRYGKDRRKTEIEVMRRLA